MTIYSQNSTNDFERNSANELAKKHALEFRKNFESFFTKGIKLTEIKELLKLLGIELISISDVPIRGRLEITNNKAVIKYNCSLHWRQQINTILHEVAHWYLQDVYPQLDESGSESWKEYYAKSFANQVCIPSEHRAYLADKLEECSTISEYIHLANGYNLPFTTFLDIISDEVTIENKSISKIWIVAKPLPNKHTLYDNKLRVSKTVHDKSKFFIPFNQSIESLLLDTSWIRNLPNFQERLKECFINITTRHIGNNPEYKKQILPIHCSAYKLNHSVFDLSQQMILLIQPTLSEV